jgi:hypothetical protein
VVKRPKRCAACITRLLLRRNRLLAMLTLSRRR